MNTQFTIHDVSPLALGYAYKWADDYNKYQQPETSTMDSDELYMDEWQIHDGWALNLCHMGTLISVDAYRYCEDEDTYTTPEKLATGFNYSTGINYNHSCTVVRAETSDEYSTTYIGLESKVSA